MKKTNGFCVMAVLIVSLFQSASAQQPDAARIEKVESQVRDLTNESAARQQLAAKVGYLKSDVDSLRTDFRNDAGSGAVMFLFGVVCALWAQNSGRNPWLWFFLGLIFSVITALVMLYDNSQDRKMRRRTWRAVGTL
jgi:outer membrane murein-binding lipoprotein Lpp